MPFYEYVCRECRSSVELLQKISDPPATDCPSCGRPALVKQVSAAGFRLKGGGWYETDFKNDGKRNVAGGGDAAGEQGKDADKSASETSAKTHACAAGACGCAASGGSKAVETAGTT